VLEDFFKAAAGGEDSTGIEAQVAFYSGIVMSTFFLAQFVTSLLWTSIAEKHGRRAVLFASLFGNSIALSLFGTSRNMGTMIVGMYCSMFLEVALLTCYSARLGQGLFNGKLVPAVLFLA